MSGGRCPGQFVLWEADVLGGVCLGGVCPRGRCQGADVRGSLSGGQMSIQRPVYLADVGGLELEEVDASGLELVAVVVGAHQSQRAGVAVAAVQQDEHVGVGAGAVLVARLHRHVVRRRCTPPPPSTSPLRYHYYTRLAASFTRKPAYAGTRKVKPVCI